MKLKPLFLVVGLGAGIGLAAADEFTPPPTREGLWETRTSQVQQGKTTSTQSVQMCQSHELTKSLQAGAVQLRKRNECTSSVTQPSTNTYVEESHCAKGPNAGSTTKVIYTHQGDTASHTEMHLTTGKAEIVMTMDAKYLGSCPAGMKPGDLIMNGKIVSGGG